MLWLTRLTILYAHLVHVGIPSHEIVLQQLQLSLFTPTEVWQVVEDVHLSMPLSSWIVHAGTPLVAPGIAGTEQNACITQGETVLDYYGYTINTGILIAALATAYLISHIGSYLALSKVHRAR